MSARGRSTGRPRAEAPSADGPAPGVAPELCPEHRADLCEKSGLTLETIARAKLRSLTPMEMQAHLGATTTRVRSALLIPYLHLDGFFRLRLFHQEASPADYGADDHRYWQRPGTPPACYIPPYTFESGGLSDPAMRLIVCEGEKKALRLDQENAEAMRFAVLGFGGLWNWRQGGRPLLALEGIAWGPGRETWVAFDSNIWASQQRLQATYAFGRFADARGADVGVVQFPVGPGAASVGPDDFLVAQSLDAFETLPRHALSAKVFRDAHQWWKGWRKRTSKAEERAEPPPEARALLTSLTDVDRLHPAQDVRDGVLFYGINRDDICLLVSSTRQIFTPHTLPAGLALTHERPGPGTFDKATAEAWLDGAEGSVAQALDGLCDFFKAHARFTDPRHPLLVAAFTLNTWVYRAFGWVACLVVRSPGMRAGKTTLLECINMVAFNASGVLVTPTEAFIYREAGRTGGLQTFDEVDKRLKRDREKWDALTAVLNVGHQQGGRVPRMEKRGDTFVTVLYDAYAPRVLAGLSSLQDTTEDRAIFLPMIRRKKSEPIARRTRATRTWALALRQLSALACLTHIRAIQAAAEEAQTDLDAEDAVDDRLVNLWVPLLALAAVADAEDGQARYAELLALVMEASAQRTVEAETSPEARLVATLEAIRAARVTSGDGEEIRPADLLRSLRAHGSRLRSLKALAKLLNPLGLFRRRGRPEQKGERRPSRPWVYVLELDRLDDLAARYRVVEDDEGGDNAPGSEDDGQEPPEGPGS